MSKVKKPFYKRVWFWLLAVITVFVFMANAAPDVEPTASEPVTPVKQEAPKPAPVKKNDPDISKAEFDAIENGMTYAEVVKIIGGEGEVMSEIGVKGEEFYTIMYMYDGEKGLGSNANFTFQDGKLSMKAQYGLK
jgi:hypothetical protein